MMFRKTQFFVLSVCKFPLKEKEKLLFKSSGFRDWKNAKSYFKIHSNSEGHKINELLHLNRVRENKI